MIKAYLDSYDKITAYVSKNYYEGKINSLYLLTDYGPEKLNDLKLVNNSNDYAEYSIELQEKFELGEEYYLVDEYGFKTLLQYRYITKDEVFLKETYTSEYLGYQYSKERTMFSLWAPISSGVILVVNNKYYDMKKEGSVFKLMVEGDLDRKEYYFLVKNNGIINKVLDPYSYSYNFDQSASVVVNLKNIIKNENLVFDKKSKVIYETSVRDFTSSKKFKYKSKFLGIVDEESLDYLDNLGIEYLQLMPITYFHGDVYNSENFYNWGYNPCLYGVSHPNYVYSLEDSYAPINECKEMINKLHKKGIKVVMDVVFNHVENREDNILNQIVPYYYYLMRNDKISNGSFCGIDLDSSAPMMNRLIKDMCKRWVKLYGIDGFRFDLMGILDNRVMKEVYEELRLIKDNIVIYGEGWNMPCFKEEEHKAIIANANKIENIGFFNDYYRESLKYDYLGESVLKGDYISNNLKYFDYRQSINYLECHDNHTYYDFQKYVEVKDEGTIIKKQLFKNLVILISKGYAFLHSGQEFFRTKQGVSNSYCSLDDINTFDWNRLYKYDKEVTLVEKMIKIREKYNLYESDFEYKNDNNVVYLRSSKLEIVMNLSSKSIALENKEILLATNKKQLDKYDLVIYKKEEV